MSEVVSRADLSGETEDLSEQVPYDRLLYRHPVNVHPRFRREARATMQTHFSIEAGARLGLGADSDTDLPSLAREGLPGTINLGRWADIREREVRGRFRAAALHVLLNSGLSMTEIADSVAKLGEHTKKATAHFEAVGQTVPVPKLMLRSRPLS